MQHPHYPQPKPSPVQSAVGSAHQESNSTATNEHARTDRLPSQNPLLRGTYQYPKKKEKRKHVRVFAKPDKMPICWYTFFVCVKKNPVKEVWQCPDQGGINGWDSTSSTTKQKLTFITFIVSEKNAKLKVWPPPPPPVQSCGRPGDRTLITIRTLTFHVSQKQDINLRITFQIFRLKLLENLI